MRIGGGGWQLRGSPSPGRECVQTSEFSDLSSGRSPVVLSALGLLVFSAVEFSRLMTHEVDEVARFSFEIRLFFSNLSISARGSLYYVCYLKKIVSLK